MHASQSGPATPRRADEPKVHTDVSCGAWLCKMLTVFMAVFVVGDIAKQLILGPQVTFIDASTTASLQASLSTAGASLSRAASAVAASVSGGEADGPVGAAATLAEGTAWAAPWAARATGGAKLETDLVAAFPPPSGINNSAILANRRAMSELRTHPKVPTVIFGASSAALPADAAPAPGADAGEADAVPSILTDGTILVLRVRVTKGSADSVRAVELSLGSTVTIADGKSTDVAWSEGAMLHTLAPDLLTAPNAATDAMLPLPARRGGAPWTHVRLRYVGCDRWGHALGDVDCDGASPAEPLVLALDAVSLRPATAAARAAATKRLCEPQLLMEGRGLSCLLPDVCPMSALYSPLVLPADGKYSGLMATTGAGVPGATKLFYTGALAGEAQGFRCGDVVSRVTVGCKLARGWSTHKAVYRGTYHPAGGGDPVAVVIKEGGIRYPAPFAGERGVGFSPKQDAATQRATLQTMVFEMSQEVLISELLAGHPGIPRQLGACMDASDTLLATSVQAMGGVHIGTKRDLVALARRSATPTRAALRLAQSAVSLFEYVVETRYLRLEDLHWQVFDLKGNVRTNFSDAPAGMYAEDDLSQFAVDSEDLETGLNLQLIDLDKLLVSHDTELRWYVAEQMMPFVAAQLLSPLQELLPGLRVATKRMLSPDVLLRPPSFACLRTWLAAADAEKRLASLAGKDWPDLPCDPRVYNEGVRSRWENPHFG